MTVLAPEQHADLERSGLTDATVALMQVAAVPPGEIKLRGVNSAYVIPYFNLDGTVNCFQRRKLFPPVKTDHGTMRYWQPPNTSPHLYLPPLLSWQNVARHSTTELTITEGEKKAACACQHGLITAGIGGVWNWRSTLDNGEKFTLPMLDEFQWTNRSVLMCPDSDAWHDGKEMQILAGFFAFAKELQSRGADVQFVMLPDLHGQKAGLDDWLLVPGHDVEHSWPKLDRIALDNPRFNTLTAWWQKWKEKQATHAAIKDQEAEELDISETAGLFLVHSKAHSVRMTFDRLSEARGGVYAELSIMLGTTEIRSGIDLGLKSDSGQSKLASGLKSLASSVPWKWLLQKACALVLKRHRHGEPIVELQPSASAHVPFLVNPLIYSGHQTLLYAPGGSLKSFLTLFIALLVCNGLRCAGLAAVRAAVLYLDWELDAKTVGGRLKALQASHPDLSARPYYRRCEAPLHQEAHQIAAFVAQRDVKLVIIDSAAMACGGELSSPDAAINLQRALRKIGCASLVLAHVAKNTQEGQEKSAYGTVFFRELARNVWELTRAEHLNPVHLAMTQNKNNFGPKHDPLGFSFTFEGEIVSVASHDIAVEPEFDAKVPIPSRIRNLLEDGRLRTAREIADELELKLVTVKSALSRGKGHKWQQIGEDYRNPQWTVLRAK